MPTAKKKRAKPTPAVQGPFDDPDLILCAAFGQPSCRHDLLRLYQLRSVRRAGSGDSLGGVASVGERLLVGHDCEKCRAERPIDRLLTEGVRA